MRLDEIKEGSHSTLLNIIAGLRRSWSTLLDSNSQLFIYGTAATGDLSTARDIDVFAVTYNPRKNVVVRVETSIQFSTQNKKMASLYIIPFQELLKDIFEHSCGGRWTVVGLHGMWGEFEAQKNEFIDRCLASVFYHYKIPETITANEVVRTVTRVLCAHYPFYAKSAISVALSRERWKKVAKSFEEARQSRLYEDMKVLLQKQGKRISKKEQQSRYFSSEIWSRPDIDDSSGCGISSLRSKIERTIDVVEKNSRLLDNTFGSGSTECVIQGLNSISTWNVLRSNVSPSVKCEYGGRNKIMTLQQAKAQPSASLDRRSRAALD